MAILTLSLVGGVSTASVRSSRMSRVVLEDAGLYVAPTQSRTQSNACARARMALALGKLNFSCAVIG